MKNNVIDMFNVFSLNPYNSEIYEAVIVTPWYPFRNSRSCMRSLGLKKILNYYIFSDMKRNLYVCSQKVFYKFFPVSASRMIIQQAFKERCYNYIFIKQLLQLHTQEISFSEPKGTNQVQTGVSYLDGKVDRYYGEMNKESFLLYLVNQ